MVKYENIVKGEYISRPNRFIAEVVINGSKERAHVKNTGRCRELLVPGAEVYLQDHVGNMGSRKLRYSLIAVEKKREHDKLMVNMDSQAPNKIVKEALENGIIRPEGLGSLAVIKGEHKYNESRLDFYMEDISGNKAMAEVKGVTLEECGTAMFPDAPTDRGIRHIDELIRAKNEGYRSCVIFVIQMKGMKCFVPNRKTHPEFAEALCKAQAAGVEILAYDCIATPDSLRIDEKIHVIL